MIEGPTISKTAAGLPLVEWTQRNLTPPPKEGKWTIAAFVGCMIVAGFIAKRLSQGDPQPGLTMTLGTLFISLGLFVVVLLVYLAHQKITESQRKFDFAYVDPHMVAVRVHAEAYIELSGGKAKLCCAYAYDPRSKVHDRDRSWRLPDADAIRAFSVDDAVNWGEQHPGLPTRTSVIVADCGGIGHVVATSWGGPGTMARLRDAMHTAFLTNRPRHGWAGQLASHRDDDDFI